MRNWCLCLMTIVGFGIEIEGGNQGTFRSDLHSGGRPILRGGLEDLLDNINLDINVRVAPIETKEVDKHEKQESREEKEKHDNDKSLEDNIKRERKESKEENDKSENKESQTHQELKEDSREASENDSDKEELLNHTIELSVEWPEREKDIATLRKRPIEMSLTKDSSEEFAKNQQAPKGTAMPAFDENETEEALTFLRDENDEKYGQKISEEDKSEEPEAQKSGARQSFPIRFASPEDTAIDDSLRDGPAGSYEWVSDLKKYVTILAQRYEKERMIRHIKPVIKVLERTHQMKIRDIDSIVKVDYVRNGK